MFDFCSFLQKYYPNANHIKVTDVKRFLENLNNLAQGKDIDSLLQDKSFICKTFFLQKAGNNISRSHYQKVKEYLINLFDYLGIDTIIPTREEVIVSSNMIGYYRSLDHLLSYIDSIGELHLVFYNPKADLIRLKGLCVLGWHGFSLEEITNIKKNELINISNYGIKINTNHGEFEFYDESFRVLFYLKDLEEYNGLPSGRKIILRGNDEFLFRPVDSDCNQLDTNKLIQIIKRFNACTPPHKNSIIFRNLYKNAAFLKIYHSNDNGKALIEKIMDEMHCTYNYALSYKQQYLNFVDAFESGKI